MLEKANELGFSSDQIIFTGDTIAYCANPLETAHLLRDANVHVIMGNCEEAIAANAPDCGCGFVEDSACSLLSVEWYAHCKKYLDADISNWMGELPRELVINLDDFRLLATHATPDEINRFVFPSSLSDMSFVSENYDGFIVGHSGIPFLSELDDGKAWINSGAAGMPANDGTPRVWYVIIEVMNGQLKAELHALEYDHRSASCAMQQAGLSDGYANCLNTGIWPSHDVLPEIEKLQTATPIAPQARIYQPSESVFDPHTLESRQKHIFKISRII